MNQKEVPMKAYAALVVAVAVISSAGVLVAANDGVDARVIAWWRMLGSFLLLLPFCRQVVWREAPRMALAGLFLAVHFATWFASLRYIPVMRSTLLVTIAPIWAGLIEWGILKRPPAKQFWLGLCVAIPGVGVMTDGFGGGGQWVGDGLAVLGGISGAAYFVIGSEVRKHMAVMPYMWVVCGVAALALFPVVWISGEPLVGFESKGWWLLLALVLGPQLVGHNGLNYVLKFLPASTVTAVTLLEPIGAAVLAFAVLAQRPTLSEIAGGSLVILGLFLALRKSSKPK